MDLKTIIAPIQSDLDRFELEFTAMFQSNVPLIDRMSDHLIRTKGKRLRPVLVLLSAAAYGVSSFDVIRCAAIIELIHTATLVHDDVVDKAPLRRGQPSLNSIWDNHISVLMGDFLLAKALNLIVLLNEPDLMVKIAKCTEQLSKGELLQATRGFDVDITEEEYFQIIGEKTASLVATGCEVGAYLTSRSLDRANRFREFGECLGLAFQITDDLLDFTGDQNTIGKPVGNDVAEGTVTLPLIHALKQAPASEAERIAGLMDGEWDPVARQEVGSFACKYGGIEYARLRAAELATEAKSKLSEIGDSPFTVSLAAMVDYAIDRDR